MSASDRVIDVRVVADHEAEAAAPPTGFGWDSPETAAILHAVESLRLEIRALAIQLQESR
jgi:hypothetical protein